jgi:strictosidine synthase-like protein
MRSLCFETMRPRSTRLASRASASRVSNGLACVTALLAAFAVGCSEDEDGGDDGDTVALADSASLRSLTTEIGIPTTVAVTDGVAWVVESQFDRYAPFGGSGTPSPFRLIGISLANGDLDTIPLPDGFFPEGIAATRGGRLYVGSVATGAIVTIAENTAVAADFVNSLPPSTVGMTVDVDGRTLWVCNSNTTATPPTGAVIGIDIATGETVATHPLEPSANGAFCNDMVQNPADGSLWVTESFGGRIFRIDGDDLTQDDNAQIWLEDTELSPPEPGQFGVNGITLLGGRLFVVVTDRGTLLSIDPTLDEPSGDDLREISLSLDDDDNVELVRPDGITAVPGSSTDILIVENGLQVDGGKRLLRARIGAQ